MINQEISLVKLRPKPEPLEEEAGAEEQQKVILRFTFYLHTSVGLICKRRT